MISYSSLWVVINGTFSFLQYNCAYVQLIDILWTTWTHDTHHSLALQWYEWHWEKRQIANWVHAATVAFTEPHMMFIMQDYVNLNYVGYFSNGPWNMYYFSIKLRSYLFQNEERELYQQLSLVQLQTTLRKYDHGWEQVWNDKKKSTYMGLNKRSPTSKQR